MRSSLNEFIATKEREFKKIISKIIKIWELEFRKSIDELRRKDLEIERKHEKQLKELEDFANNIDDACKSNSYKFQNFRREVQKQVNYDMRTLEQEKKTPRMLIEYNKSLIDHPPALFTVKNVTQPDYMEKVDPIRRICGDKSEFRVMSGCDYSSQVGEIYLADYGNDQIQVVTKNGEFLKPLKGVSKPWGVKVSKGLVFVTERDSGQLKVLNTEGELKCIKKLGDRDNNHKNATSVPGGVDVDKEGRVYIADSGLRKVHILDSGRNRIEVGEINNDCLKSPQDVKVVGDRVYVLDAADKLVKVFDRDGELVESLVTNKKKLSPEFFAVDRLGNMLICNQHEQCIELYDDQGTLFHEIPCNFSIPGGITIRKNGSIIISCTGEEICNVF